VILLCGGDKSSQTADIARANPTLRTLLAVLKTLGLRLSVEPTGGQPETRRR
jgi:hypothetical protein